jgi:hypothetical protein
VPNIQQYSNPLDVPHPTETGVNAVVQSARRAGAAFNEAADAVHTVGDQNARMLSSSIRSAGAVAVDYMEHREVSHGAAAYAGLNDQLTQKWNDAVKNADPNDPEVAQRFRENVLEPELEKFGQSFFTEGAQKWAETRVQSLRNHMYEKTSADMGTLAAQSVTQNVHATRNALSNTAMTDPSSVPHLLEGIEGTVGAMVDSSPNLKGVAAAKARGELTEHMREEIVKAGAIGAIQKSGNPERTAEEWGAKYPQYISGSDLKALSANARQQLRAARTDAAYADHLAKVDAQDRSDQVETGYLKKLYSGDPKVQSEVSTKAIVNDPNLTRVAKERMINVVDREMKPETAAATSNGNYIGILGDIRSGKINDVDPIYKARQDGKLNRADFNQAIKDFNDFRSPQGETLAKDRGEFFKRYAATIDGAMDFGGHSALGSQSMYKAEMDARRMEDDLRKKGQDPHSLYDPSSPNFFGRGLSKYQVSLQDALKFQKSVSGSDTNLTGPNKTITGMEVKEAPITLPPLDKREKGQVYPTPRGTMRWTGTGWVAP